MLHWFMKEKSRSNVTFVTTAVIQNTIKSHVASVHEKKKPFKCDICGYSCSQKSSMNIHVESVHKEKKPTFDFHGKIPHVLNSKNDKKHQKQNNSNSKEESGILSDFVDVQCLTIAIIFELIYL